MLCAPVVAACGSRSTLSLGEPPPAISAGSGGATSSSIASSSSASSSGSGIGGGGGEGGSAEPPPACVLSLSGPPRTFHNTWPTHGLLRPRLAPVGEDGATVTFRWGESLVAYMSFAPWGTWPAAEAGEPIGITNLEDPSRFAVAGATGAAFAVLLGDYPYYTPGGVTLALVTPDTIGFATKLGELSPKGNPQFLTFADGEYVVGFQRQLESGAFWSTTGAVSGLGWMPVEPLGCADVPLVADAVRFGDDYLIATSDADMDPSACAAAPAPPLALRLLRYTPPLQKLVVDAYVDTSPVRRVALARREAGAWLVWQRGTDDAPLAVMAARVDADGALLTPFELAPGGSVRGPFAVTSLGDRLVVAWVDALDPPSITVRVDGVGASPATATLAPDASTAADGELSLLPSPDGGAFVVAWSAKPIDASPEKLERIDIARLDCAAP